MKTAAYLLALLLISGCSSKQKPPQVLIVAIDTSASIEPEARDQAFAAIERLPSRMHRGDTLIVMPITGDAENDLQGRIIRLTLPVNRKPYDQDLRKATARFNANIRELRNHAPDAHSDILGTFKAIAEEKTTLTTGEVRVVVLSDFIQDNAVADFNTSAELSSPTRARLLADRLAKQYRPDLRAASVSLGVLRSRDLARLHTLRRESIECFWRKFLALTEGDSNIISDGTGIMEQR